MDSPFWYILGGVIVLVAAILIVNYIVEKKRTEAFQKVAEEFGFEFRPKGDASLLGSLSPFHLFSQGHSKKLFNLMRGTTRDLQVSIFDYRYTVGYGKHQQIHQQTVICFEAEDMDLPSFTLRPESFWHKIGSIFGYKDISFDSHPTFSKRYLLRGPDEDAIREVFTPEVLDFLEETNGICVEAEGPQLLYYRHRKRLKPAESKNLMTEGFDVLALFRTPAEE
ncbi:MAG TPA: hypothetical protein VGZ47_10195 [Gemmataceae bacterium]|jgi:hypothetical protein|nr:hypothetical protein [Gemmataceae bacterium]